MSSRHLGSVIIGLIIICLITSPIISKSNDKPLNPTVVRGPIEILNEDNCGVARWIRVDDSTTASNILCALAHKKDQACPVSTIYICGVVRVDKTAPDGWKFDPATVRVSEMADHGAQTTVCDISKNPAFFSGEMWYLGAKIAQWRQAK